MAGVAIIDAFDASGKQIGFAVIDLPDGFQFGGHWPAPSSSDKYFETREEAITEAMKRRLSRQASEDPD